MKNRYLVGILVLVLVGACSDEPHQKTMTIDSTKKETLAHNKTPEKLDSFSEKDFDLYKFENDSILQTVYIHYLNPRQIIFRINSFNKKKGEWHKLYNKALSVNTKATDNTATAEDDINHSMYYVFEFFYDKGDTTTSIGVEPERGKRLSFYSGLDTVNLHSFGTLRRIKLSSTPQSGPKVPKD